MTKDTKQDDDGFDTMSNASTATFQANTPPSTMEDTDRPGGGLGAIPEPEKSFQIIEKNSGRVITLVGEQPKLQSVSDTKNVYTHWHCVKQDGYFGFENPKTGKYLGHDGKDAICASVPHLKDWELWTPRGHPDGGFEMLSPYYSHTLMVLCVHEDGNTLVRRRHGTTLWEFVRV